MSQIAYKYLNSSKIVWKVIQKEPSLLTDEEKEKFFNTYDYMPYKGCGGIQVETEADKIKATELLKDFYNNDSCWNDYFPKDFINVNGVPSTLCYGSFSISKPIEFLKLLLEHNVSIVNVGFFEYNEIF